MLELVSQIAVAPEDALGAIHSIRDWIDTNHADLLGWRDVFLAHWVFSKKINDEVSPKLQRVIRVCYESKSPDEDLRRDATALLDFLKAAKQRKATLLQNSVCAVRADPEYRNNLKASVRWAIANGLKEKVAATPPQISDATIAHAVFLPILNTIPTYLNVRFQTIILISSVHDT